MSDEVQNVNPNFLGDVAGAIARWTLKSIDADELTTFPVLFPLLTNKHGLVQIEVRLRQMRRPKAEE